MVSIRELLKRNETLYILFYKFRFFKNYRFPYLIHGEEKEDLVQTKKKYKEAFGREINLDAPQTLNEKINWLKLYERKPEHVIYADKLAARDIWVKYGGADGLIPLLYKTENYKDIKYENIPEVPCVVKWNSGSGAYQIIRDRDKVDYQELQRKCHKWMSSNYYYPSQEWQYKNIKSCLIIEKLLLDKNGKLPNDYKMHYINGELQFVYCSIDREGSNYRSIYTPTWKRMDMEWVPKGSHKGAMIGENIERPASFNKMVEIGNKIARNFKYVRVDFYDVEGKLYYGEITLHHGSGFDLFKPEKWDKFYGERLEL